MARNFSPLNSAPAIVDAGQVRRVTRAVLCQRRRRQYRGTQRDDRQKARTNIDQLF